MLLRWDGLGVTFVGWIRYLGVATVGWMRCCYCGMEQVLLLWDGLGVATVG